MNEGWIYNSPFPIIGKMVYSPTFVPLLHINLGFANAANDSNFPVAGPYMVLTRKILNGSPPLALSFSHYSDS